ncbi:MAG: hypothetical protein COB76_04710 [Alphaproteobacteria bacterium]|nr:MAG: hypothetical protein COB76_04710 [Alphaproteobacteria bacterium]
MKDHPIKGISMMLVAVFLIMVMNMFAKLVSDDFTPAEIVFWRGFFAMPIIIGIIAYRKDWALLKTARLKGQIIRGVGGSFGILSVFWAYSLMPMADVVAIMFTAGLMTTALSALWLGEKVGVYRWGAVAIGFIGAVIAANPMDSNFNVEGTLVALAAAFIGGAVVSTMLRSLGKTEPAITTVFYTLVMNSIVSAPFLIVSGTHIPSMNAIPILLGVGVAGVISLLFKTQAFRYAEASLLSPIHYTSIIWGVLFGYFIWGDVPAINVLIGATIIITANIVIIWRENKKSKSKTDSHQEA